MPGRYRTIQIYLPNGDPTGIRIVELTASIARPANEVSNP